MIYISVELGSFRKHHPTNKMLKSRFFIGLAKKVFGKRFPALFQPEDRLKTKN
jgi:hypothetical protein